MDAGGMVARGRLLAVGGSGVGRFLHHGLGHEDGCRDRGRGRNARHFRKTGSSPRRFSSSAPCCSLRRLWGGCRGRSFDSSTRSISAAMPSNARPSTMTSRRRSASNGGKTPIPNSNESPIGTRPKNAPGTKLSTARVSPVTPPLPPASTARRDCAARRCAHRRHDRHALSINAQSNIRNTAQVGVPPEAAESSDLPHRRSQPSSPVGCASLYRPSAGLSRRDPASTTRRRLNPP